MKTGSLAQDAVVKFRFSRAELAAQFAARGVLTDLTNPLLKRLLKGRAVDLETKLRGVVVDTLLQALEDEEALARRDRRPDSTTLRSGRRRPSS